MLSSGGARAVIVACGEALVDFTAERTERGPRYVPHVGGASLNVAVALARLGVAAAFLGGLSRDAFGQFLRAQLLHSGVDPRYISDRAEPTALAFVQQEGGREPEFSFYGHGTAERALRPQDLPPAFPSEVEALHFAGYSLLVEPVGATLEALGRREQGRRLILLDPNVRPALTPGLDAGRARLETWLRRADVVKASRPDLGVLYPGVPAGEVARSWLARPDAPGPVLVVVTLASDGAVAFSTAGEVRVPSVPVPVIDTVGAGDAFSAGLLEWLYRARHLTRDAVARLGSSEIAAALARAASVAGLTCTRAGADPPYLADLERTLPG